MYTAAQIEALNEKVQAANIFVQQIKNEIGQVIIGQQRMLDRLLIGLLSNGHILLEGVPGLAKTLSIKSLASAIEADFHRIQFTPDLLPADIIGTLIYNQQQNDFEVRKGPIFAHFILADEINRAPAKVQSALLEAMQEKQITIGDNTYPLQDPFLVLATQNPIDQEGTYPLPEAQVDRFLMKVIVGYPTKQEEQIILRQQVHATPPKKIKPIISIKQIIEGKNLVRNIYLDEKVEQYIIDIVFASRFPEEYQLKELKQLINFGASPRGSINLAITAKANAFLQGRGFVIPEDVRSVAHDVLRHRIGLTYEAESEEIKVDNIIDRIIQKVNVP